MNVIWTNVQSFAHHEYHDYHRYYHYVVVVFCEGKWRNWVYLQRWGPLSGSIFCGGWWQGNEKSIRRRWCYLVAEGCAVARRACAASALGNDEALAAWLGARIFYLSSSWTSSFSLSLWAPSPSRVASASSVLLFMYMHPCVLDHVYPWRRYCHLPPVARLSWSTSLLLSAILTQGFVASVSTAFHTSRLLMVWHRCDAKFCGSCICRVSGSYICFSCVAILKECRLYHR